MTSSFIFNTLIAVVLILAPHQAHAYLDLPSASMILQAAAGALAVGLVTLKVYWHKLKTLLSKRKPK